MTVIPLKPREPLIWVCECGCDTHHLFTDGTVKCGACSSIGQADGEWVKELPEPPAEPKEVLPGAKTISFNDASPKAALRRMLERVDPDTLVAIIAIQENGRVRTWGGVGTQDRAEWLDRRLADARGLLTVCIQAAG